MFKLSGKTAIVTGGASGIGKAISELFAKQGAQVFVLDIGEGKGDITQAAGRVSFLKCDLTKLAEVKTTIEAVVNETGRLDLLVNNAGISHIGNVETTTEEDFDRLFAVNVRGMYHTLKTSVPYMKEKGGAILNIASTASHVGLPERFAYSMTKGAVSAMTLSVARDYLSSNIRCNSLSPARVHTPFVDGFIAKNYPGREEEMFEKLAKAQPIGRMGRPEEIAAIALFLCSDEAGFVTGNDYAVDGGFLKLNT